MSRRRLIGAGTSVLLLLGLMLWAAGTAPVLRFALPTVNRVASEALSGTVEVTEISGSLWSRLSIGKINLEQPDTGLSVAVQSLSVDWLPLALFQAVVRVNELSVQKIDLSLPVASAGKDDAADSEEASLPLLPVSLRVNSVKIPDIVVRQSETGRDFRYRLSADAQIDDGNNARLGLNLEPQGEEADYVRAAIAYEAELETLSAEIDASFNRRGLVMALAGLPAAQAPDVTLTVVGDGPLDGWTGQVRAAATGIGDIAGQIGLGNREDVLPFSFAGNVSVVPELASGLPTDLLRDITFEIAGDLDKSLEAVEVASLHIRRKDAVAISGNGRADLSGSRFSATLRSEISDRMAPMVTPDMRWSGLTLHMQAEGPFEAPVVDADVTGLDIRTEALQTDALSLIARLEPVDDGWSVTGDLAASGQHWQTQALNDLFSGRLEADLAVWVSGNGQHLKLSQLSLPALTVTARGEAKADGGGDVTDAAATVEIGDLSRLRPVVGLDLSGAGRVALTSGRWRADRGGEADVTVEGKGIAWGQGDLDRVVGTGPVVVAGLALSGDGGLTVSDLSAELARAKATGSAALTEGFGHLETAFEIVASPGVTPPESGVSLEKGGAALGRFSGPVEAPAGQMDIRVPVLSTGGGTFSDVTATGLLDWREGGVPQVKTNAAFQVRGRAFEAAVTSLFAADRLRLDDLALSSQGMALEGRLEMPGYQPPLGGALSVRSLDAAILGLWDIPVVQGAVQGRVGFVPAGEAQTLKLDLAATDIVLQAGPGQPLGLARASMSGTVGDAFREPTIDLRLDGEGLGYSDILVDRIDLAAAGTLTSLALRTDLSGRYAKDLPLSLQASAEVGIASRLSVHVPSIRAKANDQVLTNEGPLSFRREADGAMEGQATLAANTGGRLEAVLSMEPGRSMEAQLSVKEMNLDPWGRALKLMRVKGVASVTGHYREVAGENPQAEVSAVIRDLTVPDAADLPPFNLTLDGGLSGAALAGRLKADQAGKQLLDANARMGATVSLLAGTMDIPPTTPIAAQVALDGEVADFWPYVPLPDHALSGRLQLDANVAGTWEQPQLDGTVAFSDGRYEHLQFGTLLGDITLQGAIAPDAVTIDSFTANDGGQGQITGSGALRIGANWAPSFQVELQTRNAALVRLDELRAWADIDMQVTGNGEGLTVTNKTTVRRGEVDLAVALPTAVPELEVENLDDSRGAQGQPEKQKAYSADLDMTVDIPDQFFVRGKGLDSEWGGQLRITGQADAPEVVGRLTALRGQLDVIGKSFAIQDSIIAFTGGQPIDPLLDIRGVYKAEDLSVIAALQGPASAPELSLSSDPPLPQDEILAQVLFGKSQGNLTAGEAIQLASAAAELSGGGGGLDVVGSIRRFIGVDVLRVEAGDDGPTVRAGEYLTDDVYVGTVQGSTPGSTGVEVEIELAPRLKATTEATGEDTKAGLQFKYDY